MRVCFLFTTLLKQHARKYPNRSRERPPLVSASEQFIPADDLRIATVSDLHLSGVMIFDHVAALAMLGDNSLQVVLADQIKQPLAMAFDVIHIKQANRVVRQDSPQSALALNQRQVAQVLPI